jgi:hypothetical protein
VPALIAIIIFDVNGHLHLLLITELFLHLQDASVIVLLMLRPVDTHASPLAQLQRE